MRKNLRLSSLSLAAVMLGAVSAYAFTGSTHWQLAQAEQEESPEGVPPGDAPQDLGDLGRDETDAEAGREGQEPARPRRERPQGEERPERSERPRRERDAAPEESAPAPPAAAPAEPEPAPPPAAEEPQAAPPPAEEPAPQPRARTREKAPPADAPSPEPESPEPQTEPQATEPPAPAETREAPDAQAPDKAPDAAPRARRDREGRPREREGRAPAAAPSEVKDLKELKQERKERSEDGGKRVVIEEPDNRVIVREGERSIIRADETERFRRLGGKVRQEKRDGLNISINVRPGGIEIFTETDDRGRPLRRYRRDRDGREVILFDNRDYYRRHRGGSFSDAIVDLPPPRITIPRGSYVVDYEDASDVDIYDALSAPPVERLERTYSLEEVRHSPNLRARMRRIDLDVINFDFGAWGVSPDQYPALERIADAMNRVIDRNPDEIFMVEGHTDAVGSDEDNLSLSDRRAETVAIILTEEFGVPPENIVTQGYGEHYLKINTQAAERQNRRVAVRRITPLISRGN